MVLHRRRSSSQVATHTEERLIHGNIEKNKRVTKITQDEKTKDLLVPVVGESKPLDPYTTVFNLRILVVFSGWT